MKRLLYLILPGALIYASCSKSERAFSPYGKYTEKSPVNGRCMLNFLSDTLVVRSEPGTIARDTYYYTILPDSIKLQAKWNNNHAPSVLYFKMINANTFTIENLYPTIPKDPISYMTFQKF